MKKIISLFTIVLVLNLFTGATLKAQIIDAKGITILALNNAYTDAGKEVTEKVDQVFNISFTDKILAHTIFIDGYVDNSQIYQLSSIEKFMKDDITNFKFSSKSGVSGSSYFYLVKIDKDNKLMALIVTQEDGSSSTFTGDVALLRTFVQ